MTKIDALRPHRAYEQRYLIERQWKCEPLRSAVHIVGWQYDPGLGIHGVKFEGPSLKACKFTMSDASKAMRKRFTDMRRRFIQSLYRGRMAGV